MSIVRMILIGVGVILLAGLAYLLVVFFWTGQEVGEPVMPEMELAQIQVNKLTAQRADMDMGLILDNPAPVGILIDSLDYTLFIEEHEVVTSTYPDSLYIQADQKTSIWLPVSIYYDRLGSLLEQLEAEGRDTVRYTLHTTLYTDAVFFPDDRLDIQLEERLPLLRVPEVSVTDLNIEDLGVDRAVIHVETYIVNENVFAMGLENMRYSFRLGDQEPIEGHKLEPLRLEAKDTTFVSLPVEVDFADVGRGLLDLLREGPDLGYDFYLNANLVSEVGMLEESEISMQVTGNVRELREVAEARLEKK